MIGAIIGAVVGAGVGIASTGIQSKKAQEQARKQKEMAWSQYLLGQAFSDRQFSLQRGEALDQLNVQQSRLNQGIDAGVAQMNSGLLAQAYSTQNAMIQTAGSIGASLTAEGAGGTRNPSGGGLMRAYEQLNLDRNIALQNDQNNRQLAGMTSEATNAFQDITRQRGSWAQGGYQYESKQAQDEYNRQMALLGQSHYNQAISDAKAGHLDYIMGAFGGTASGMSMGASADNLSNMVGRSVKQPVEKPAYVKRPVARQAYISQPTISRQNTFASMGGQAPVFNIGLSPFNTLKF